MFWPSIVLQLESPSSPQVKLRSPNTMNVHQKTNKRLYKIQNSSLWISVMRDPYIDDYREVSHLLGSWLVSSLWSFLFPLGEWRSLTHPWSKIEWQVWEGKLLEDSMIFHLAFWSLPFVHSRPSHPTEEQNSMHHTLYIGKVICIAPPAWSFQYVPALTIYEQFSVENFWEMM